MAAPASGGATIGHEAELWSMADALRGSMDAAEYKHVVLGLIFLKYISDAFEERRAAVLAEWGEDAAEDRDEYVAENVFWVPAEARWAHLRAQARQPTVGLTVDQAMAAIERDNPVLTDVLPRDYARPALDKRRLGQLIDLVSNVQVGDADARSRDVLGRVYEYFLSQFASAEGKKGGEFYTPRCVVKVLVGMLEPYRERRQGARRHQHLRPGVELHDVAARGEVPAESLMMDERKARHEYASMRLRGSPRRIDSRWCRPRSAASRFNEAAGKSPQNPTRRSTRRRDGSCFNEAAGKSPQNPSSYADPPSIRDSLQ